MKKITRIISLVLGATMLVSVANGQQTVVIPQDLIANDFNNMSTAGWRMFSTGNSNASLVNVNTYGISPKFGAYSIRSSREGGSGLNRSFIGYFENNKTLSSLKKFSWFRFTEKGTDTYLNIFINNGSSLATVVYQPAVTPGKWEESEFNNSVNSGLFIRINNAMTPISYNQLIEQYGSWKIINHPEGYLSNFIGGIVIVSGSSSPTAPQAHTFDFVTVRFDGQDAQTYNFDQLPEPPPLSACTAAEVIQYNPAKQQDGSEIPSQYANPANALGEPENDDNSPSINAVTLGFGGSIVLKMSSPVKNGTGNDFKVFETSGGLSSAICQRHPERVMAFASQNGCDWVYVGSGCQDVEFDLGELNWASYIKLVDVSPIDGFYQGELVPNGYDVDGIVCLNGFEENPLEQDLGALYAMNYSDFEQGLRKNGTPVPADRSNPSKIMGKPQNDNTMNFVSLGFSGSIVLELGYTIFDKPGYDLKIYETSFGNPSCSKYPEYASFEVSLDKVHWVNLGGTLCQDGKIDLGEGGVAAMKYLRVTDRSPASKFSGTADGYDIDGITVLQPGCEFNPNAITQQPEVKANERLLNLISNGNSDEYLVMGPDEITSNDLNYRITNLAGQLISNGQIKVQPGDSQMPALSLNGIQPGIYFITFESDNYVETVKMLKR